MQPANKPRLLQAILFILLFGIVSLFSDITHEGASSIRGAYLSLLGASAGTIGFISGLGELIGYSMRYVFGKRPYPQILDNDHFRLPARRTRRTGPCPGG